MLCSLVPECAQPCKRSLRSHSRATRLELCAPFSSSVSFHFLKADFLILLFPPSLCTTKEASNCGGPEASSFWELLGFLLFPASFCGFSGKGQVGIHKFGACSMLWSTQEMVWLWNYCPGPQQELKVSALLATLKVSALLATALSDTLEEGTYFPHTSAVAQMQM